MSIYTLRAYSNLPSRFIIRTCAGKMNGLFRKNPRTVLPDNGCPAEAEQSQKFTDPVTEGFACANRRLAKHLKMGAVCLGRNTTPPLECLGKGKGVLITDRLGDGMQL